MAYFGGTVSERPWPKFDIRFMLVFIFSCGGIAASIYMARGLPLFDGQPTVPPPAPVVVASAPQPERPKFATILVASENIAAGVRLNPSMFRFESRAIELVEDGAIRDVDDLEGSYARLGIAPNTPLLRAALTKTAPAAEITSRIPAGFRAVAIPVNALTGVEGWVRPGATVDVVWSTDQDGKLVVSTIVENAKVLSVERSMEPEHKGEVGAPAVPNHITLLVSSIDAQRVQLAKGSGSLNLSLRGTDDGAALGSGVLTSDSLLNKRTGRGDIQGKVVINGEQFVLREKELVPSKKFEEELDTESKR